MELYDQYDREPPCEGCYVSLDEVNQVAAEVFIVVRSQVQRDEEGNLMPLDLAAILAVMTSFQVPIEDHRRVLGQVLKCFGWAVEIMKKNTPAKAK